MALPPATAKASRAITTLVTSAIWWLILYFTGRFFATGGKEVAYVSPLAMANITALSFVFIPYFATHGVLISLLDRVLKEKIILPPEATPDASARPSNPWQKGVVNGLLFGLVPAAVGYYVSSNASADTITPRMFAVRYASAGALLVAIVVFVMAGAPFLRATRVPRGTPACDGDPQRYLWQYFVWPHGIGNAIINGALAYALSPVPFGQAGAVVPAAQVVIDAAITFLVLTWIIVSGVRTQARVEAQWGIAPPAAASQDTLPVAFMTAFFSSLAFAVAVGGVFWLTKVPGLSVTAWAVFRGLACGVYTAWLAKLAAQAVIGRVLNPEASAKPTGAPAE
jgi:hypothetical protein